MRYKITIIISILLIGSVCLNIYQCTHKAPVEVETKTKIEYRTRTVKSPVPVSIKDVGKIPVSIKTASHADRDTVCDTVYLPRKQMEYRDSDYTAYVSGYDAKLDSIAIRTKYVTTNVVKTRYRRFNIGLIGGYGYGIYSKSVEPFIGVGIAYNLFK